MAVSSACFVSYATPDKARAAEIVQALEDGGVSCWLAPRDVPPGANWGQSIIEAIESCAATVLLLSAASNESVHVANEVERAVSKKKRLFPVRLQDVSPGSALELHVSSAQWIDIFTDYENQMKRLLFSIRSRLGIAEHNSTHRPQESPSHDGETHAPQKFAAIAAKFRPNVSRLSTTQLAEEVGSALNEIVANEAQSWGSWYVNDTNSRAVFGKLRRLISADQEDEVRAVLRKALDSKDPLTMWKALKLLLYFGERRVEVYREYWEKQKAWIPRQIIVEALDCVPVGDRVPLLCEIVRFDNQWGIRSSAFEKVLSLPTIEYLDSFVPAVEDGLRDENAFVRSKAVAAVALIDNESAVEIAKERLAQDADNGVRVAAAEVLGKHGSSDSVALLVASYESKGINEYVISTAVGQLVARFGAETILAQIQHVKNGATRDLLNKTLSKR